MRGLFTGVVHIVRFNWHFYVIAVIAALIGFAAIPILPGSLKIAAAIVWSAGVLTTLTSLIVSWYVYDLSGMYRFDWIPDSSESMPENIVNIHAGFDEISELLKQRFPDSQIKILDFYDPVKHTEVSIKRARKAYPSSIDSLPVQTNYLPLEQNSIDMVFLLFAAHEIRDDKERTEFFRELSRIVKKEAPIYVVEHLCDWRNFLAYSIGCFHFHSKKTWIATFRAAELHLENTRYINPFVTLFTLYKK